MAEIQTNSKSEYKRIKAQVGPGVKVNPPLKKNLYSITAFFKTGQAWIKDLYTEEELNTFVEEVKREGWLHKENGRITVYPAHALEKIVVEQIENK